MSFFCANCGNELSDEQCQTAAEEAKLPIHDLRFFCPDYNAATERCVGDTNGDTERPAKWIPAREFKARKKESEVS